MPSNRYLEDYASRGMRPPKPGQQAFKIGMLTEGATRMTCVEAHCVAERQGWFSVLDPADEKHRGAISYIENDSGRRYLMLRSDDALARLKETGEVGGGLTVTPELLGLIVRTPPGFLIFYFYPGQQCFRPHLDREVLFAHQRKDAVRVHTRPLDFNEHFNLEADKINEVIKRG